MKLTWQAGSSDNGSPIIDYAVYLSSDGGISWVKLTSVSTTNYVVTALTAGMVYEFKVEA